MKSFLPDAALGFFDGVDSVLWCYAFATIIFVGVLEVYLPLGVFIFLGGWALLSIFVALSSRETVHMIAIDEQAVVIIGSLSLVLVAEMGDAAASPRGLTTLLAIMCLSSLSIAFLLTLAGRIQLTRLLEHIPYPVICGFMAGIGWLLLDAGVLIALDSPLSIELYWLVRDEVEWIRLLIFLGAGLFLFFFTMLVERSWSLPVASCLVVGGFFTCALSLGYDLEQLRGLGWLFEIPKSGGGLSLVEHIDIRQVDAGFLISALPELMTILFLTTLAASMNLSAMSATRRSADMDSAAEIRRMGIGNLLCAGLACPPGYTDAPASILYRGFGARSRWMPLASSFVCLVVAFSGDWFISFTPKVLIGATIFLFALQLFYDWMYDNVRNFSRQDYAIVCAILLTVILFGFMLGILVGLVLTIVVFVLRYSMVPAIQDQYSLIDRRSSVERSISAERTLQRCGGEALVCTLRGYLFFGTANQVRDTISGIIESGAYSAILLDFRRVIGVDVSALNAFAQINSMCAARGIGLHYSCVDTELRERLERVGALGKAASESALFDSTDHAIERIEEDLLSRHTSPGEAVSVRDHLRHLLMDERRVDQLMAVMLQVRHRKGDYLFRQGDADSGFYILESGALSAMITGARGQAQRVKKFLPGSIIGELSGYTAEGTRTASVVAESDCVLYYVNPESLEDDAVVHELVARALGIRIDYMNRRLLWELM